MNMETISNFERKAITEQLSDDGESSGEELHYELKASIKSIEGMIDENQLSHIHDEFKKCDLNRMTYEKFRKTLKRVINLRLSDEGFNVLFMKIDSKGDGYIDWDEFVSHILLELQEKDMQVSGHQLDIPMSKPPRIIRSRHRHPVCRVTFCPSVTRDRVKDYSNGKYLTASHDGIINYWNGDMKFERTVYSESTELLYHSTWITDLICLPDLNIVCSSSSERDLRFYDTTAENFQLRLTIIGLQFPIMCMDYHFSANIEEDCLLVCGDQDGSVIIFSFTSKLRGPFYQKSGTEISTIHWEHLVKGQVQKISVQRFLNIHSDWVQQVRYYPSLNSFISCALCTKNAVYLCDMHSTITPYSFKVQKGVTCFDVCAETHLIVTGGPDCKVRLWSAFISKKASTVFQGHHAPIVTVILQDFGSRVYSLSKDKIIKVWGVESQVCIQTYTHLSMKFAHEVSLKTYYNKHHRNLIIGGMKLAVLRCGELLDKAQTDGYTHSESVTAALYNPLFKSLVTVGLDSCITLWDPWTGKIKSAIRNAHTEMKHGKAQPVGITAATFDPEYQMLLTGAVDGTLNTWNFNTGARLRSMSIERNCEVTGVAWLKARILAMGSNRHVTEFADTGRSTEGKNWDTRHTDDILCFSVRQAQTLATGSYTGELILWRLETGQPYGTHNVIKASKKYEVTLDTKVVYPKPLLTDENIRHTRRVSDIQLPSILQDMVSLSVHAIVFLSARPMHPECGTLLCALQNGTIQIWSHYATGRYMGKFLAIHTAGDYVLSMKTDEKNQYLFTGHSVGYIKIWLMTNYMIPENFHKLLVMPLIRLQFPFLLRDRIEGRAKRTVRDQPVPLLLSSYQGHVTGVNHIEYISECKVVISCSSDKTVRFWTLGGQYLGTLGSFHPWTRLHPNKVATVSTIRHPPDIKKNMSSTTLKVLNAGKVSRATIAKKAKADAIKVIPADLLHSGTYGKRIESPILGKYFKLPEKLPRDIYPPKIDTTYRYIPVYTHLRCYDLLQIERMPTPKKIAELHGMPELETLKLQEPDSDNFVAQKNKEIKILNEDLTKSNDLNKKKKR